MPAREDWGLRSEKRQLVSHCTVAYLVSSLSRHVSPLAGCLRGLAIRPHKMRLLYFYFDTLESLNLRNWDRQLVPHGIDWVSFRLLRDVLVGWPALLFLRVRRLIASIGPRRNGKRQSINHITVSVDFQSVSGSNSRTSSDARYLSRQRPQSPSFKPAVLYHSRLFARIRH